MSRFYLLNPEKDAGRAPEPVWNFKRRENISDPTGISFYSFIFLLTRLFYFVLHEFYTMCVHNTMFRGSLLLDVPQVCSFTSFCVLWEFGEGFCLPSLMRWAVGLPIGVGYDRYLDRILR